MIRSNMMLDVTDFFLERVLEEAAHAYAPLAKATGAELLLVSSPDLPLVCRADASRVQKLFTGLLSQAVFLRGGEVRMDVCVAKVGPLCQCADARCVHLRIVVSSIPPDRRDQESHALLQDQSNICGMYDQLGLDKCIELARVLGGNMHVRNASGPCMSVTADIVLGMPASQPPMVPFAAALEAGRKALVIDDNASSRIVMMDLLQRFGLETLSASSFDAAVQMVQMEPDRIGVVFVDADLVSGEAMLSGSVALGSHVPVVTMDFADASLDKNVQGTCCVTQGQLLKPITQSALRRALEAALGFSDAGFLPGGDVSAFSGLRVLVVDDNTFNLEVFESILSAIEIQVATAKSGLDALAVLEGDPDFDAVLMDMQMPEMDGCEATRRIRGNPKLMGIPILALTANTAHGAREECLASGMNDFLTKPVNTPAMLRALARWIPRRP